MKKELECKQDFIMQEESEMKPLKYFQNCITSDWMRWMY